MDDHATYYIYISIQWKCVCTSSGIGTSASSKSLIQPANPHAYHANTNRYTHSVKILAKFVEHEVMCAEGGIFFRNPLPPVLPWGTRHYSWLPHCKLLTIPTESQVILTRKKQHHAQYMYIYTRLYILDIVFLHQLESIFWYYILFFN